MDSATLATVGVLIASSIRVYAEWLNGDKNRHGWLWMMGSSLVTMVWSYATQTNAFFPLAVVTMLVAFRGYRRWDDLDHDHRREIHRLNNIITARDLRIAEMEGRIE